MRVEIHTPQKKQKRKKKEKKKRKSRKRLMARLMAKYFIGKIKKCVFLPFLTKNKNTRGSNPCNTKYKQTNK